MFFREAFAGLPLAQCVLAEGFRRMGNGRKGLSLRDASLRMAVPILALTTLAACSPDHLVANDYRLKRATVATYEDTRLTYSNADPKRAATALLPTRKGRAARHERYEDARTPHCDDPRLLRRIERRVPKETEALIHKHLTVVKFGHPVQSQYVPRQGRNQIAQRFCRVKAQFSDHKWRAIFYVAETPMGFAGVGHNMTYCIAGIDPWYVHGDNCSSLRDQGPAYHSTLPEKRAKFAKKRDKPRKERRAGPLDWLRKH